MNEGAISGWAILGWVLFTIVLIIAIIFLILWLTKNKTNSALNINGLRFNIVNQTTLVATWDSTGNPADTVTIYADTVAIKLDSNGKPVMNSKVLIGGPVPASAKTVSISNLAPNTTYFVSTVVSDGTNFSIVNHDTVHTGSVPTTDFMITEIHTTGAITLNANGEVVYDTAPSKSVDDLWKYDVSTSTLTAGTLVGGVTGPIALYNNNGILAAANISSANITSINSQWIYNTSNQWCLKSTPNLCMNLSTPVTGTAPVSVLPASTTQWKNVAVNVTGF